MAPALKIEPSALALARQAHALNQAPVLGCCTAAFLLVITDADSGLRYATTRVSTLYAEPDEMGKTAVTARACSVPFRKPHCGSSELSSPSSTRPLAASPLPRTQE